LGVEKGMAEWIASSQARHRARFTLVSAAQIIDLLTARNDTSHFSFGSANAIPQQCDFHQQSCN
jgi:hypothetical protein